MIGSLWSGDFPVTGDSWTIGLMAIGYCLLGWLVIDRQPRLRIGWLLLIGGTIQAFSLLATWWAVGEAADAGCGRSAGTLIIAA